MIANDTMGTFDWSILIRGIGSSWTHSIVMICKHVMDIRVNIKLSTLVHKYILVFHKKAMDLQPLT